MELQRSQCDYKQDSIDVPKSVATLGLALQKLQTLKTIHLDSKIDTEDEKKTPKSGECTRASGRLHRKTCFYRFNPAYVRVDTS